MFSAAYLFSSYIPILGLMVHYFMFKKIALSLSFTLFLGLLCSCSPNELLHLKKAESSTQKSTQNTTENTKSDSKISQPIALPPRFKDEPLQLGQTKTAYLPNGLPALKSKGINVETLFSENIKDSGKRFNRVENAVVDLRQEFETYKPAIVRLSAVEADIQNLITELEVLLQETPSQQPTLDLMSRSDARLHVSQLDPQPQPPDVPIITNTPPPQAITKKPPEDERPPPYKPPKSSPKTYNDVVAQNLRVGEHAEKVRLVIDTNHRTAFTIDLDNAEKLIIIEMPKARWVSARKKSYPDTKLIESYTIEPLNNGAGTMMIIALSKDTKILQEKRLTPDTTSPHHRIYFDLKL